ncbi:30S ribosomal protein S6 [Treponema socranskii]|uniref:30S ribosomal protein S6 n=1 Tax=Treponema TaxID=157 RepID=UPI001651C927|nr:MULTISPECIES: 30S ribosomal protein S6 [unclassified Treponema]MBC6719418.1 30S ribosomal protein S6 [Treponema sp. Marseille-Q4130]MBM7023706.1 30S ribosomal protein S6 [Treponema sp. Marseille-Q4523]
MRKYELMTVFPLDEEKSKKGADDVRSVLNEFGAEIEKEEPFGDRDLTYEIKKQKRGRFILFTMKLNPAKIVEINKQFKLNTNMLKYLFVKLDEKEAN